ncbi:MBL fold metallo-hydrolase [uncultured Paludibaculum sp.]|uniref:MBL fold metallo-hydrolase n=1 Tax=uncultured Paludibaculum sp. TaxID=1765020 RepID=UPI002AAC0A92|nr:MBL fold metallo-hydrolase [uncultured Paludibaculum sp.]
MRHAFLVGFFLAACPAFAQQQDFSKVQMKVTRVSGSVYMLEGSGGNIGVSAGEDGIVIVDDQFAPLAGKIREALKGIVDKPVRFVINTHFHGDHTGGNLEFGGTSTIIAQDNVRKRLMAPKPPASAAPQGALPVVTFEHDVTVHMNGEDIRALHFPSGHTDGDAIIFFPKSNVVHMGDDFVRYGFPFIDVDSGGSIDGMIDAMEKAIAMLPADVKVIPGHGALSTVDDIREYVKMLKGTREVVKQGMASGKSADDLKKAKVLDAWQKWSGDFIKTDGWVDTLYNSLSGHKNVGFTKHN